MLIFWVLGRDCGDDVVVLMDVDIEGDEGVVLGDFCNFIFFEFGCLFCLGIVNDGGRDVFWVRGVCIDFCWEEDGVDESIVCIYVGDMMKMDVWLIRDEVFLYMSV